jgi:hypothetical protein
MGTLEDSPGPGVEDSATPGTAKVEDGLTEIPMGVESRGGVAAGAAQPGAIKEIAEEVIACILIQLSLGSENPSANLLEGGMSCFLNEMRR